MRDLRDVERDATEARRLAQREVTKRALSASMMLTSLHESLEEDGAADQKSLALSAIAEQLALANALKMVEIGISTGEFSRTP